MITKSFIKMLSGQIKISKRWAEYLSNYQMNVDKFISIDGVTKFVYRSEEHFREIVISEEDSWFVVYSYMKFEPIQPGLITEAELLIELNQRLFTGSFLIKDKRDAELGNKSKNIFFKTYQRCFGSDEEIDELIMQHINEHDMIFKAVVQAIANYENTTKMRFLLELFEAVENAQQLLML